MERPSAVLDTTAEYFGGSAAALKVLPPPLVHPMLVLTDVLLDPHNFWWLVGVVGVGSGFLGTIFKHLLSNRDKSLRNQGFEPLHFSPPGETKETEEQHLSPSDLTALLMSIDMRMGKAMELAHLQLSEKDASRNVLVKRLEDTQRAVNVTASTIHDMRHEMLYQVDALIQAVEAKRAEASVQSPEQNDSRLYVDDNVAASLWGAALEAQVGAMLAAAAARLSPLPKSAADAEAAKEECRAAAQAEFASVLAAIENTDIKIENLKQQNQRRSRSSASIAEVSAILPEPVVSIDRSSEIELDIIAALESEWIEDDTEGDPRHEKKRWKPKLA